MKFTSLFAVLSILALGSIAAPAWADAIPVQNASFEITSTLIACGSGCFFNFGPIPDWTTTSPGPAGSWHPTSAYPPPDGSFIAYSNGGTISQTLSTMLAPNTTYTLIVAVGDRPDGFTNTYTIALDAGGIVLNSRSGSSAAITPGTFADQTVTFTTGASVPAEDLAIVLTSDGQQIDFDNVRLTASTVPEPSSLSLLAGALGVMFLALRLR